MNTIKIHIFHTGEVCVAPALPFGGDHCSLIEASGLFCKRHNRLWLPVSVYLIVHPQGMFLVDTGWSRRISPDGQFDRQAQIRSLGSLLLYLVNQGQVPLGKCIDEQLLQLGIRPHDLTAVLLTHLDCDHANGIAQVATAPKFLVARQELEFASRLSNRIRYSPRWWKDVTLSPFEWNDNAGPVGKSYDLLGDHSLQLINIPGHSDGLCAVKVTGSSGKYVLLYSDGGYASRSWQEMVTSGIAADKKQQKLSLSWIREQSLDPDCLCSLANHDPEVSPQVLEL